MDGERPGSPSINMLLAEFVGTLLVSFVRN